MEGMTERIARIVENDATGGVRTALKVAQSDIMGLLCEFMDVVKLDMTADKTPSGYVLNIRADVARFYDVGRTSEIECD